ncbi:hypothetical protein Q3G72_034323 [Acer saccharum]|nr:hypothetical protein Q3G72_034323 [Acer saccharum]
MLTMNDQSFCSSLASAPAPALASASASVSVSASASARPSFPERVHSLSVLNSALSTATYHKWSSRRSP